MKRNKYALKKNARWEEHELNTIKSLENLGFSCIKEDTQKKWGVSKVSQGKADITVYKNNEICAYIECKSTTAPIEIPIPGRANPKFKYHQLQFLREQSTIGIKCFVLILYEHKSEMRLFAAKPSDIDVLLQRHIKYRKGKLIVPQLTFDRLNEQCRHIDIKYDGTYDLRCIMDE